MVASLITAAGGAYAQDIFYSGNVAPDMPNSCAAGVEWVQYGDEGTVSNQGGLVQDPDAVNGWAWRIQDLAGAKDHWRTSPAGSIDRYTGVTIVGRLKTISESAGGGNLGFLENSGLSTLLHWGGPTGHLKDTRREVESYLAGDAEYHTFRVTALGPKTSVPYLEQFSYEAGPLAGKGAWYGSAGTEVSVGLDPDDSQNSVAMITGGAGASDLYQDIWADADPTTGLITVVFKAKRGQENPASYMWGIWINDANGNNLGRFYGSAMHLSGRIAGLGVGFVTEEKFFTGDWDELKMEIDPAANTTKFFFNGQIMADRFDAGHTVFNHYSGSNTPSDTMARIRIERWERIDAQGEVAYFDDLSVNGKNIGFPRQINVYVDENPMPAMTIEDADSASTAMDAFCFGAASTSGAQDIYFDFITGTTRGAFAPGEELPTLGYSLLPSMPNGVAATIAQAKSVNNGVPVNLTGLVTQVYHGMDAYYNSIQVGFLLQSEEGDSRDGIRVLSNVELMVGSSVLVQGVSAVAPGSTEKVVQATGVTELDFTMDLPQPVAMNNLATGGGAFGTMKPVVNDASQVSGSPCYADAFAYSNGPLGGTGGWAGNIVPDIGVADGAVRIIGGRGEPAVVQSVSCGDCGTGEISVKLKVKPGAGAQTIWDVAVLDPAGLNLARLMGTGTYFKGRIDVPVFPFAYVTADQTLQPGWNDIEIKVKTATGYTEFYINGVQFGNLDHNEVGAKGAVGSLRLKRLDNHTSTAEDFIFIDDLAVYPSGKQASGLNTMGVAAKIYGTVTAVVNDGTFEGSFFYVDDGSNLKDGTSDLYGNVHVGIRCRPLSYYGMVEMPQYGDYVWVTGAMGGGDGGSRLFWTGEYGVIRAAP